MQTGGLGLSDFEIPIEVRPIRVVAGKDRLLTFTFLNLTRSPGNA